jgi:hypothetical protein
MPSPPGSAHCLLASDRAASTPGRRHATPGAT